MNCLCHFVGHYCVVIVFIVDFRAIPVHFLYAPTRVLSHPPQNYPFKFYLKILHFSTKYFFFSLNSIQKLQTHNLKEPNVWVYSSTSIYTNTGNYFEKINNLWIFLIYSIPFYSVLTPNGRSLMILDTCTPFPDQ